jgi:flagellar biosynthesis protein FlhF
VKIKSFFAATVEAALERARVEFGPEALILDTRQSSREAKHLGDIEIVAGLDEPAQPVRHGREQPEVSGPTGSVTGLGREMAELRRQLDTMSKAIAHSVMAGPGQGLPRPEYAQLLTVLSSAEIDVSLAHEIVGGVQARVAAAVERGLSGGSLPGAELSAALCAELDCRIAVDATLGRTDEGPRVAAFVGPPGAGKTTTLVKLAVAYGLKARRAVQIVSADTYRIGAAEQLRSFAAILGAGFQVAEAPFALAQAIQEHRNRALILIDTPGFGQHDMDEAGDLAGFLSSRPDIDTHLVLMAGMKSADLTRAMDRFDVFRPAKLLFTRLDETDTFGPLLSASLRSGKPLSFFATGQQIPQDVEPADRQKIIQLILQDRFDHAQCAA